MNAFFRILLIVLLPLSTLAQSSNAQRSYLNGKDLFNSGKYALAIEAFKPLTTYSNAFSEYATFFYGLSSYHDGQTDIAKNIFLQLTRKYPSWSKKNEALFWLGKIYFDKQEFAQGAGVLQDIKDRTISAAANKLLSEQLVQADLQTLRGLNVQYSNNKEIAQSLAAKLTLSPMTPDDQELFEELIRKFNFKKEEISNQLVGPTLKKDSYKVAICFPFMVDDLKNDRKSNSNQWVLDMYQGIVLGKNKLSSENISVEIFAYDTGRDSTKTANIFSQEEMRSMDLVIGPLYPEPSELAASFTYANRINIVNPLSSNLQIIANNPYSFLFNASDETKALASAEFMADKINKGQKALVVYGSRINDSIAAFTYQQALQAKGVEVLMMDQVPTADAEEIARFISDRLVDLFGEEGRSGKENIGHIYVASSDELIVGNVIGTIDNISPEVNIMGNEDWLRSRYTDFKQLERMQVYLTAPGYLDYSGDIFKEFQKKYKGKTGNMPNRFSFIGYDMMLLFGKFLNQGGTYFQHDLQKTDFYPGTLFQGFSYQGHNDNQYVPIVKFQDGLLTLVN